jgi:Zn-dependent protease with chaperone function
VDRQPVRKFRKRFINSLMDTHPSTADRIRRLEELEREING